MSKFSCVLLSIILGGILISCSGENLYEFEELSDKSDFVIQLVVIPEDPAEKFGFQTTFFKTDGFGRVLKRSLVYNSSGQYKVVRNAVKEYKTVGVTFTPQNNISRIEIKIYDILFDDDVFWQSFENIEGKITLSYDFERDLEEIIRE